jgi:hypothetical protein
MLMWQVVFLLQICKGMVVHVPLSLSCHCEQSGACTAAGFKVLVIMLNIIDYQL